MADLGKKLIPFAFILICLSITGNCSKPTKSPKVLKFLFYTGGDDGSHHAVSAKIAASLVGMGHDVTFLLSKSCTKWLNASDANLFKFAVHKSNFTAEDRRRTMQDISRISLRGELKSVFDAWWYFVRQLWSKAQGKITHNTFNFFETECDSLLGDNETLQSLEDEKFDILVGEELSECQPLLAQRLGLRFIHICARGFTPARGDWYGVPSHPAYIPVRQAGLTDRMTFPQRLKNFYLYGVHKVLNHLQVQWFFAYLQRKYRLSPELYMSEMLARAELQILIGDFELEFARPLQPNTIMHVLPLLEVTSSETEIPKDIQDFLDTVGDEGAVLFSLGSHVNEMETEQAQMFADGFARLPQRVLWQFTGNTSHVHIGNNTKIVKWMPQKQLMDHPKTKAFVNHGGLLGVLEAGWYGLPLVGIPLFGNHFDNMERVVAKGMGLKLEITTLTPDILYDAVTRVMKEPRFRERAQHISRMMRDQLVNPADKAAFWITHVTKYGGEHLRPKSADLTWVQYHLIDVYAFLGAILLAVTGFLFLVCRGCIRLAIRYSVTPKKMKIN